MQKKILLCCIFFLFFSNLYNQEVVQIGKLIQFDTINKNGILSVEKKKYFSYLKEHWNQKQRINCILTNQQGDTIANFQITKLSNPNSNTMKLHGQIKNTTGVIYVGLYGKIIIPKISKTQYNDRPISYKNYILQKNLSKTPNGMVYVPKGAFLFGFNQVDTLHYTLPIKSQRTYIDEENQNSEFITYMKLPGYYIDQYEVSVKEFSFFLYKTGEKNPYEWKYSLREARALDIPVYKVSYTQAEKYCKWRNKRLPTELEWEKAARGSLEIVGYDKFELPIYRVIQKKYPTDTGEYNAGECNTAENGIQRLWSKGEMLVNSNPYKIFGMCGNAPEWTSSWLIPYRGNSFSSSAFGKKYKVIRGGSFEWDKEKASVYYRLSGGIPNLKEDYKAGFRCAKSVSSN